MSTPAPRRVLGALSANALLPTPPSTTRVPSPIKSATPLSSRKRSYLDVCLNDQENASTPAYSKTALPTPAYSTSPTRPTKRRALDSSPCARVVERAAQTSHAVSMTRSALTPIPSSSPAPAIPSSPIKSRAACPPSSPIKPRMAKRERSMDEGFASGCSSQVEIVSDSEKEDAEEAEEEEEEEEIELPREGSFSPYARRVQDESRGRTRAKTPVLHPTILSSSPVRVAPSPPSPEMATRLQLRLKMAMYKVLTEQTTTPVQRLQAPTRAQVWKYKCRSSVDWSGLRKVGESGAEVDASEF